MNFVTSLLAAPLFVAFTMGMTLLRNAASSAFPAHSISVPVWGGVVVATQAAATWANATSWIWLVGRLGERPSLTYLAMFAALGLWIVWHWADEAEWERVTGWIVSPSDEEMRWDEAVEEASTRALLIGTAAGFALSAVWLRFLPPI